MFADSLLESSWENRSHRGWTTVASFAAQLFGLGLLLSLPLLFTEGLPRIRLLSPAVPFSAVPSPPPAPQPQHAGRSTSARELTSQIPFITPTRIPTSIPRTDEPITPPLIDMRGTWMANADAGRNSGPGVPWGTGSAIAPVAPPPVVHRSQPPISVMMQGNLIDRVQPLYPAIAKAAHIQGAVVLIAVISRDGTIQNLQVISGHPMLVKAAMEAVKQWRYRPYVLNGQPVEVETQVTVNFVLAGG